MVQLVEFVGGLGLEPTELVLPDHHAFTGLEDSAVT